MFWEKVKFGKFFGNRGKSETGGNSLLPQGMDASVPGHLKTFDWLKLLVLSDSIVELADIARNLGVFNSLTGHLNSICK